MAVGHARVPLKGSIFWAVHPAPVALDSGVFRNELGDWESDYERTSATTTNSKWHSKRDDVWMAAD